MIANIWITSSLIVSSIFLTGAIFKSYSDIQEAKQIQEHYETIKNIKSQIALRYNLDPNNINKDDIISHLPKGENWENILFTDRQNNSATKKDFLVSDGNITISKDERLKILALKAKIRDILDTNKLEEIDNSYKINVGAENENTQSKERRLNENINKAINYLYNEIVMNSNNLSSADIDKIFEDKGIATLVEKNKLFFYYEDLNSTVSALTKDDIKKYLKQKLKEELLTNSDSIKSALYEKIESKL